MDKDVIILLVNGFCVIVTVYCFVSDYYVIALVGMVSNFFLSFWVSAKIKFWLTC